MSAETDYIAYLETKVCDQAFRIGDLEASLLYILNLREHKHNPDTVYIKVTAILQSQLHGTSEFINKYNELING